MDTICQDQTCFWFLNRRKKSSFQIKYTYVCISFFVPVENFHSYGDVTITGKGRNSLSILGTRWPLSSKSSLACYIYSDMGHPFIWSSLRTRDTHICCRALKLAVELPLLVTTTYVCRGRDSNTQRFGCYANALSNCLIAAAVAIEIK